VTISPGCLAGQKETGNARILQNRPKEVATVVLADQAALIHMALRALLAARSAYAVVGAARTVFAAEQLVRRVRPRLLICDTDIAGESGIDLCRRVRLASPRTRVAILTSRDQPLLARAAVAAGATGYLLKDTAPDVLATSLDGVAAGKVVLDTRLGTSRNAAIPVAALLGKDFSRREGEVLAKLISGLDNKSIADQLCIAEETVKSHMKAIFRKLGARDRAHAAALALGVAIPPAPSSPRVIAMPAPRKPADQ
jgi:DNA-binding NarL/FixJ family response regulator